MVRANPSWLKASELMKDVWRIDDNHIVSMFLVAGREKALLVDAGWGIGSLAEMVSELCPLPVTLVNTHGHADHVCGNFRLDHAHIHEADVPMMKNNHNPDVRYNILKRFSSHSLPHGFSADAWVHAPLRPFTSFKGPTSFDLGGRTIEVVETPGHTPGSVCLYDDKERLLFTGDNIMEGATPLTFKESLPLRAFAHSMDRLAALADKVDMVLPSHGNVPLGPAVLKEMREGVHQVLEGRLKGTPSESPFGNGLACRFGSCGITYREDNL